MQLSDRVLAYHIQGPEFKLQLWEKMHKISCNVHIIYSSKKIKTIQHASVEDWPLHTGSSTQ
jgi:hypothetical protein